MTTDGTGVVSHVGSRLLAGLADRSGLAMLAYALLAVLAATEHTQHPAPDGLIALTCNEIHHPFNRLILEPARRIANPLSWSYWRRRHQYRARTSHYQRRPET